MMLVLLSSATWWTPDGVSNYIGAVHAPALSCRASTPRPRSPATDDSERGNLTGKVAVAAARTVRSTRGVSWTAGTLALAAFGTARKTRGAPPRPPAPSSAELEPTRSAHAGALFSNFCVSFYGAWDACFGV